jgi:5-methylthioadenosine/S-adenosylhomocysteine deaminase
MLGAPAMKKPGKLLLTALVSLSACVNVDEVSPFDPEEGSDDGAALGKADSARAGAFQPGCKPVSGPLYALGGTVLAPGGAMKGYVVVQDDKILSVVSSRTQVPAGAHVLDTGGITSPGFIDLHNHVNYDFIPLWNSGKRWSNRYQWARAAAYQTAIKNPYNAVKNANHMCEAQKYGEFRALVGGTTSIQGTSTDVACGRSWVRNVEYSNFCADNVRQNVLAISSIKATDAQTLNAQFQSGATKAFFVHLAEGIDASSANEFEQLRALDLLKPQVVGIHSTGLTDAQIAEMGKVGMKIVWSPLSNLILYGKTTNIPAALKAGVKVSLAPDWSPSGSANVLGELKVADRVNRERFGGVISDLQLWQMVTSNPADIAGWGDKLGRIAAGYQADLVVIRGGAASPYRTLIDAAPADVLLTTVGGRPFYGTPSLLSSIDSSGTYTPVAACGEARSLRAVDTNPQIPQSSETLDAVNTTFANDGVTSEIPLFQCTPAPEWAFQ